MINISKKLLLEDINEINPFITELENEFHFCFKEDIFEDRVLKTDDDEAISVTGLWAQSNKFKNLCYSINAIRDFKVLNNEKILLVNNSGFIMNLLLYNNFLMFKDYLIQEWSDYGDLYYEIYKLELSKEKYDKLLLVLNI